MGSRSRSNGHKSWLDAALAEFAFLQEFGFRGPEVDEDGPVETVSWLHDHIGLEVELDWHEFDVSVLFVRLEEGRLPGGYYVSNGRTVRVHLQQLVKDEGWPLPPELDRVLLPPGPISQHPDGTAGFAARLRDYALATKHLLPRFLTEGEQIFR